MNKCGKGGKDKERRGNTPNTQKRGGETPQNAAKAPTPFTDKKPIQSPFEKGNSKTSKEETQKRPKEGNPKTRDNP